jgi:alkylhydroperoxidase family enzyme
VTFLSNTHAAEARYQAVLKHFSEKEIVELTMVIIAINS